MASKSVYIPRGVKASLSYGSLPEVISPYLIKLIKKTGGVRGPIGLQFVANLKKENKKDINLSKDPLTEDEHEVAPGLVYKYRAKTNREGKVTRYGRALWTITRICSSYCRFCTRGRVVGLPKLKGPQTGLLKGEPLLSNEQIDKTINFLRKHPAINEIIVSGGDPLVTPRPYFETIINKLSELQNAGILHIIRVGTRVPISNPRLIKPWHYRLLKKISVPYLMVHINHPAELTQKSLAVIKNFRIKSQAIIMSQTVLLRGVNDDSQTLCDLFNLLVKNGIRPYYLYQNDPVPWARHFTVSIREAIRLWQKLRPQLSGLSATARFVIDTPQGSGKIPIPDGEFWRPDYSSYYDFNHEKHIL